MEVLMRLQFSVVVALLVVLAALVSAPAARADIPACDTIVQDPTVAACSCICEAASTYSGCDGISAGLQAPTPGQCPDMLQGRHVLSRGDGLVLASPFPNPNYGGAVSAEALVYQPENQGTTSPQSGLGMFPGVPWLPLNTNIDCHMASGAGPFPDHAVFARLFDLPYDVVVQMLPTTTVKSDCGSNGGQDNMQLVAFTRKSGGEHQLGPAYSWVTNPQWTQLAVGDFNYDGYDDLVFLNVDAIQMYTAVDPADPTKGIERVGSANTRLSSGALRAPINTPVTGDFNGDGILDVAWIGGNFQQQTGTLSVFFASICPGSVVGTICDGKSAFQVILDPAQELFPNVSGATSTIALHNATLTPTACGLAESAKFQSTSAVGSLRAGAIALGNFEDNGLNPRGAPVDELVVTYVSGTSAKQGSTDFCSVDAQYWSFSTPDSTNPVWAVQRGSTFSDLLGETHGGVGSNVATFSLYAQAAYLDWYGATQQAVLGLTAALAPYASWWWPVVVSVNGSGAGAEPVACAGQELGDTGGFPYAWGLGVGRFSTSTDVDPADACNDFSSASPGECPYNPQIAMLLQQDTGNNCCNGTGLPSLHLYKVIASNPDSSDSSRKCANDGSVWGYKALVDQTNDLTGNWGPLALPPLSLRAGNLLGAGDPFGNSVRLGQPTVTRVDDHSEPQLIIQAPPSHVDYVEPNQTDYDTGGKPVIVNFTRAPGNFKTQIQFASGSSDTASTRETRSISSSTTETVSGEVKYKVPLIAQVDAKDTQSWTQFHESNHQQQLSTYSTKRLQTNVAAGADDQIWWTETAFNVFNYPELGVTECPASTTCDPTSDPVCTGTFSNAELTCSKPTDSTAPGYPDCTCLSANATEADKCPTSDQLSSATPRSCAQQPDGSVCCTVLPQQLNVSFSGPEEVIRNVGTGATIEWYQPLHEPGQMLSYPSSIALINARQQDAQTLASLDNFTLSNNTASESIEWSCGSSSDTATGTTTRHSFKSDSAITFGTNKIAEDAAGAASATFDFDYQHSDALSTLNTYTVGQTASSSVALSMQNAGFFDPDQYGYNVSGTVFGATRPDSVLDNPDLNFCPPDTPNCSASQEVQVDLDCRTTGSLTVAYTADPPGSSSTSWWGNGNPYRAHFDVALNNPLRWRKISDSAAFNSGFQCRGDPTQGTEACYDANNVPGAGADFGAVWSSEFYNMKGFFVTDGGTTGPMRNTATVGDTIYLRARVYNYSLLATNSNANPNSVVYARFYRQQIDVNDPDGYKYETDAQGHALPAVPIGPKGLGDTEPVLVVGPDGVSHSIPGFNTSSNPVDSSKDNIGLATVSYTTGADDDCEYDQQQPCSAAYYVYWVTVWAGDANGVIPELPGHNLGANFNSATIYDFITSVPLEQSTMTSSDGSTSETASFTNNVGMFKMLFAIVSAPDSSGTLTAGAIRPRPGLLSLDRMAVSSDKTVLGKPVVVSAQVVEDGESAPGATVVFSDGDPNNGGKAFDAEWLPTIRAHDRHFVSVNYHPESCGPHVIYADVTGGSNVRPAGQFALLDVGIDYHSAIRYLIRLVEQLAGDDAGFDGPWRKANAAAGQHPGNGFTAAQVRVLRNELVHAERALDAQRTDQAIDYLHRFEERIAKLERQGRIDKDKVDALIAKIENIVGCVH